jgi:ubiquinone/menaquinone biosynthesis C-methylase UbiE
MERIVEPELMLDPEQASAYSDADFTVPHQAAIERFRARFPRFTGGRVLDLACGPADVTVRFARAYPTSIVFGVDGSAAMLALGRGRVAEAGLDERIRLEEHILPDPELAALDAFDAVFCTSALHHFHDPSALWDTVRACAGPETIVLVQDLMRPDSVATARAFVDRYAGDEPEVLRRDYFHSLCAAFTVDEVRNQVVAAGLASLTVEAVSNRHLLVTGLAG